MNEEQKNIETCLPENILSEVANVPTDPQFRSLTDEALDPLKQQALRKAGYDGYIKVAGTHQPYTFTSSVKQMKSNLILLLRRLWRFPFGRGTTASSDAGSASSDAGSSSASVAGTTAASAAAPIRSLADMWQHYITRLKGNPEYGIPSRLSQLTDLSAAPALLADRKISGVPEAADGMSLVQLLGGAYNDVEELTDDNEGWTMSKAFPANLFPNLVNAKLRMVAITVANALNNLGASGVVRLEGLTTITSGSSQYNDPMPLSATEVYADDVETSDAIFSQKSYPNLQKVSMKKLRSCNGRSFYDLQAEGPLKTLIVPELRSYDTWSFLLDYNSEKDKYLSLIHLEIGSDVSCNIANWAPTNALDASKTDLIEEGSTATNNLQQFLSNFKTYIAERLTDKGTGLTLTLSQEVRNAIHAAEDEYGIENIIITKKGWTISPAPN